MWSPVDPFHFYGPYTQQTIDADKIHRIIVNISVDLLKFLSDLSTRQSWRAWVTTWLLEYHVTRLRQ